ncbi:hypothetical protein RB980_002093 [Vibrio fluvialis]|nr:hypothetical protein [Vibrio fluvialis]
MKYWIIDPKTRLVVGSAEATKWNIPRNALLVEPLPEKEGFAVVASEDLQSTEYIEDYRGQTIYNKLKPSEFKTVLSLGAVEDGFTLKQPPSFYHTFDDDGDDWQLTEEAEIQQLTDTRKASKASIDNTSSAIAQQWTRFSEEYLEREAQALAFKEAGYTGECGNYITMYSTRAGKTEQQATDIILQQADGLRALQEQVASERMRKYELDACETVEAITALTTEICNNLKAIGDSYE